MLNVGAAGTESKDLSAEQSILDHTKALGTIDANAGTIDVENESLAERRNRLKHHIEKLLQARHVAVGQAGSADLTEHSKAFYDKVK